MIKKILVATAVLGTGFVLTGCDLNNEELSNVIEQCKADEECLALINQEIDAALDERGIYPDNPTRHEMFDEDRFYVEFTDEELELLEVLDALDLEFFEKIENMTDEELRELQFADMEDVLGRELSEEEKAAFTLIESLFGIEEQPERLDKDGHKRPDDRFEEDIYTDEVSFLEYMLDRTLTDEEKAAVELVEGLFVDTMKPEKPLHDEDLDMEIDSHEDMMEYILGRELTEEEKAALVIVDGLHEEAHDTMMIKELEYELERELTTEEIEALEIMKSVEKEYMEVFRDVDFEEIDFAQNRIDEYEAVLGRELTEEEIEAINFIHSEDFFRPMKGHDMDDRPEHKEEGRPNHNNERAPRK